MQSTVEQVSTVQHRVKVSLQPEIVTKAFDSAFRTLQKKAQVRGFRPGKAPMNILKKLYGQSIAADVADDLIKEHLFGAIKTHNIHVIAAPQVEQVEMPKTGEAYAFSAIVDVLPPIEIKNYKNVAITNPVPAVDDKLLDQELGNLQKSNAKRKDLPEGAVIANGVVAHVTQEATQNGARYDAFCYDNAALEIGAGKVLPSIEENIIGLKKGDEKTFTIAPPGSAEKDAAVEIKVKIGDLFELVEPKLDDEFAKDLGLTDLNDLRAKMRERLERTYKDMRRSVLHQSVVDKIAEANPFEIPPSLVAKAIDDSISEAYGYDKKSAERASRDPEERKRHLERATRRTRNTLILWEVAKKENITVSDEDIEKYIREQLFGGRDLTDEKEKDYFEKSKARLKDSLRENLIFDKAVDFLLENAKVTDSPKK